MNKTIFKLVKGKLVIVHLVGRSVSCIANNANVLPTKKIQKKKFLLLVYAQPYQFDRNKKSEAVFLYLREGIP